MVDTLSPLKEKLLELAHLKSALAVLNWDQEVNMPAKGASARAAAVALLAGIIHEKFISIDEDKSLTQAKKLLDSRKLDEHDAIFVREVLREYEKETKLPAAFVKEFAELTLQSQHTWAQARAENNFKLYLPYLKKIVAMTRQQAEYLGYNDSPYDALLDLYEPGATSADIAKTFDELKQFLVPFIQKIKKSTVKTNPKLLTGKFPIAKQEAFSAYIAAQLGFDFDAGRIDRSTHPFATNFHPHDVRITTRYSEKDLFYSLSSTMHEVGHALYEQGIVAENFGTPFGESISLGIHESQSRTWENLVGRNIHFWRYFYPKLKRAFPEPFANIPLKDFYAVINTVKPSLIRTESDEVTYNLHIIIRFEIEKAVIEGTVEAEDLPQIWNTKYKEYLGVTVPNDSLGVLQDVHWSCGYFGYFPTYALGNLYSAQFFHAAKKALPDLTKLFARGELLPLREWLKANIHMHGKYFTAEKLAIHVTGEPLNPQYFIDYLTDKYSKIYHLH